MGLKYGETAKNKKKSKKEGKDGYRRMLE